LAKLRRGIVSYQLQPRTASSNLVKQAVRSIPCEGLNPVSLLRLDAEADMKTSLMEHLRLSLHGDEPLCVPLADVHVNAERFKRVDSRIDFIRQVAGESRHGSEVLRMHCSDVERAETAIGGAGDMELPAVDLVVAQELFQKFRENTVCPLFKEQMIGGRYRAHNDVTTPFGLSAPISFKRAFDSIESLGPACKSQHGRITLSRVVSVGKNDFISNCYTAKPAALGYRFSAGVLVEYQHDRQNNQYR